VPAHRERRRDRDRAGLPVRGHPARQHPQGGAVHPAPRRQAAGELPARAGSARGAGPRERQGCARAPRVVHDRGNGAFCS
jgi:hypothetical protein